MSGRWCLMLVSSLILETRDTIYRTLSLDLLHKDIQPDEHNLRLRPGSMFNLSLSFTLFSFIRESKRERLSP